jgi:hypothetical protein
MPEFGYLHDDGLQYLSARGIYQGLGYRISSLPETPAQTKYPPLFSAYLSMVWRLNPSFPENLKTASFFLWATLAVLLGLTKNLYKSLKLQDWKLFLMLGVLMVNPYLILFGVTPFSEVTFTCLVLGTLLLIEKEGLPWAAAAGLLAGCAYLTRTAGIGLLPAVAGWLYWKGKKKEAAAFAVAMLPAILGWSLWSRSVIDKSSDLTLIYYVDYLHYEFINIGWDNLLVVIWKNLDQALYGLGALILPEVVSISFVKILTQVFAVAAISGVVRLVRRGLMVPYALFALVSIVILVLWHFPPNERLVLPLFPLVIAGFMTELEHLATGLKAGFRNKDRSQRAAAVVMGSVVGVLLAATLALQLFVTFSFLEDSMDQKQARLKDLKQAYTWISSNLPASAKILSYDDPLMYLYTGRQGNYLPLLPRDWYADDHEKMVAAYKDLPGYCRARGLEYVYFTSEDLSRDGVSEEDRDKIFASVKANPGLVQLFQAGIGTVYKVR